MEKNLYQLTQKAEALCELGKPRIGFGLMEPDEEILESLRESTKYASIILVGPQAIEVVHDFEKQLSDNPEEMLAAMLAGGNVEGIVRGTLDGTKTYDSYLSQTGEVQDVNLCLLETPLGHQFFSSPINNVDGWEKEERLRFAVHIGEFLRSWGIEPRLALITGVRHETYERKMHISEGIVGEMNKIYEETEWILGELTERGFRAKNWAIDSTLAIESGYNALIWPNGLVGNQVARMLMVCGGNVLSSMRLGLSRPYEENSRTEKDYEFHIKWLVAMINGKASKAY